jgi:hypothetical protein
MKENVQTMDEILVPNTPQLKNYKAKSCWKTEEEIKTGAGQCLTHGVMKKKLQFI